MSADLTKPFGESCCDGGECGPNDMSAQSCGCDRGANWTCQRHQYEQLIKWVEQNNKEVREERDGKTQDTP